jgi:hypothetical protein
VAAVFANFAIVSKLITSFSDLNKLTNVPNSIAVVVSKVVNFYQVVNSGLVNVSHPLVII